MTLLLPPAEVIVWSIDVYGFVSIYGCIWVFMGAYGCLWVSMNIYFWVWVFRWIWSFLWVFMGIYGCLWVSGCLWVLYLNIKNIAYFFIQEPQKRYTQRGRGTLSSRLFLVRVSGSRYALACGSHCKLTLVNKVPFSSGCIIYYFP